jgi:hypothetical protein
VIGDRLAYQSSDPDNGKHDEDEPCDFQPKLVYNAGKVAQSGTRSAHDGPVGPGTPDLLPSDAGSNAYFPCSRDIRHCSRFYQRRGLK